MSKARTNAEELRTSVLDSDIGTTVLAPNGNGSNLTGIDSLPSQSSQSGKFLTTNGSAASWGVAGGAWDLLGSVSANEASTVTFENLFTSDYSVYVVSAATSINSATNPNLKLLFKVSSFLTSGYQYHSATPHSNGSQYISINNASFSSIMMAQEFNGGGFMLTIYDPLDSAHKCAVSYTGTALRNDTLIRPFTGGGSNNSTGAVTGIRVYPTGGTFVGSFQLYGLKK